MRCHAPQLVVELFDAGAFDLRGLVAAAQLAVEYFPALLPVAQCAFGSFQLRMCLAFGLLRGRGAGIQRGDLAAQLLHARFVARQLAADFRQHLAHLRQFAALPLAQFAGVLQLLLGARHFRALLVEAALHARHPLAGCELEFALLLHCRLGGTLRGHVFLQAQVGIAHGAGR